MATKEMCDRCAAPDIAQYIAELQSNLLIARANQVESENNGIREPYTQGVDSYEPLIRVKKRELTMATSSCRSCLYKIRS